MTQPEQVQRELCSKRDIFLEDLGKVKVAYNKAKSELYKEASEEDHEDIDRAVKKMLDKLNHLEGECKEAVGLLRHTDV